MDMLPRRGQEFDATLSSRLPRAIRGEAPGPAGWNQAVLQAIDAGEDPRRIVSDWQERLETFIAMREKYLLYK